MRWLKNIGRKVTGFGKKAMSAVKGFGKKAGKVADQLGVRDVLEDAGREVGKMGMDMAKEGLSSAAQKAGVSPQMANRVASMGVSAVRNPQGVGQQMGAMARQGLRRGVQGATQMGMDRLRRGLGRG